MDKKALEKNLEKTKAAKERAVKEKEDRLKEKLFKS